MLSLILLEENNTIKVNSIFFLVSHFQLKVSTFIFSQCILQHLCHGFLWLRCKFGLQFPFSTFNIICCALILYAEKFGIRNPFLYGKGLLQWNNWSDYFKLSIIWIHNLFYFSRWLMLRSVLKQCLALYCLPYFVMAANYVTKGELPAKKFLCFVITIPCCNESWPIFIIKIPH